MPIWVPWPDASFPTFLAGAGADFVMLGGMLAGHSESGGELIERDGKKYKLFYGMSSEMAMKKYSGGVAEYRYV